MTETGEFSWRPLSWYCPNCGQCITAYQNGKGEFKAACSRCRTVNIRIPRGRRHGSDSAKANIAGNFSTTGPVIDYKINEHSIHVGFDRPGIIFDYHLMPLTSQVRNFMLSSRAQRVIL